MTTTTPDRPVAVSVLGPPASGKSTLTAALASRHPSSTFRLREYARHRAAQDAALADAVRASKDPLGWLSDSVAGNLVNDAVRGPFRPAPGVLLLLEGYPGNPVQAAHLADLAASVGAALLVLDLQVDQETAWQRARTRRVCPVCGPGSGAEPHRPAEVGPDGECARCGGRLQQRRDDTAGSLAARTGRFHHHYPRIRSRLQERGVPWHTIDTRCPPAAVVAAADAVLGNHPYLSFDPGALIP
ncbi:nucleoside monophosphate kinase [Sphaerisporangium sp. NPDC051017]|uniref:nucleoside monophosphate kinase n=1 Tax=Sphaerisporangium sp. NPDC051017 TaxID=3154636 RepID=UPI00342F866F